MKGFALMNKLKKFLLNGFILTLVSLIMRTVSVFFNAYLSNTVGAEGMGLFTLITSVYGFALTLATSGVNLAATRLVSDTLGKNSIDDNATVYKTKTIKQILRRCIAYSLFFSISAGVCLFIFSDQIGISILHDKRTILSLKILALSLPPISISSALSGYFTAVRRVYKNAIVNVLGQAAKIGVIILLLGSKFSGETESACIIIVIGTTISEIISFLIQLILYYCEKSSRYDDSSKDCYEDQITKKLLGISLPVAFSTYIRSALITIEHILIPIGLEKSGASKERSLADYGVVQGMVFPLVLYPSAILSSFAGLLVPEIARSAAVDNMKQIRRITLTVMKFALIFAIGVAGIIGCFSYELGATIYPDSGAGKYIRIIAPLIPVMYIDTSVDAILKGLGQQVYSMWVNIIDASLSVILVVILLPKYGIMGFVITVFFTEILNATLSITRLIKITEVKPNIIDLILKPLFCIVAASSLIKYISNKVGFIFTSYTAELICLISLSVLIYLIILYVIGTLKKEEITYIWGTFKKDG